MYKRPRIIPVLLLDGQDLVKTVKFKNPIYLGDPINALRIFNDKEVDEISIMNRSAWKNKEIDYEYLRMIASEAFMPLSYGGGIKTTEQARKIFAIGFEKVIINSAFIENPELIRSISNIAGKQSVVVSIDYKKDIFGRNIVYYKSSTRKSKFSPLYVAKLAEQYGAGELIITCIDNEGSMLGYDYDVIYEISKSVNIPIVANGGAGSLDHINKAIYQYGASAVAASSMFVY